MSETLIVLRSRSLRGRPFADDHAAAENVHAKAYKKIRNRDEQWERVMADVSMQLHVDALLRKACRDGNFARTEECLAAGANAVAYDEAYEVVTDAPNRETFRDKVSRPPTGSKGSG